MRSALLSNTVLRRFVACGTFLALMAGKEKRKRVSLTPETKLELIRAIRDGCSQRFVSEKFCAPKSTVADIWKGKEKIEEHLSASEYPELAKKGKLLNGQSLIRSINPVSCCPCRKGQKVLQFLALFFRKKEKIFIMICILEAGAMISRLVLGWLERFCIRHRIKQVSLQGESLSADFFL